MTIIESDEEGDYSSYYDTPEMFAEYAQTMSDQDHGIKLALGVVAIQTTGRHSLMPYNFSPTSGDVTLREPYWKFLMLPTPFSADLDRT